MLSGVALSVGLYMATIWTCKIGGLDEIELPNGADLPMRQAIAKAFIEITGQEPEFLFSGWGGQLDKFEMAVVKNDDNLIFDDV
jgi:hypothetical protein